MSEPASVPSWEEKSGSESVQETVLKTEQAMAVTTASGLAAGLALVLDLMLEEVMDKSSVVALARELEPKSDMQTGRPWAVALAVLKATVSAAALGGMWVLESASMTEPGSAVSMA